MRIYKKFFVVLACLFLLFLPFAKNDSLAACDPDPSVKVEGDSYTSSSIQDAYDYASSLGSSFTLQLAGDIFTEDLVLNGGAVMLDGGYDCTFTTKTSPSSVFGTVTISTGSLNFAAGTESIAVVSTDQCDFDTDLDGFTRIGSCLGSADDCNDTDLDINPGAIEICDGFDNNCDGQVDEGLPPIDVDGDGYYAEDSCGPVTDDCNDNNPSIHPDALEIPYDGIDQDCYLGDLTFPNGNACADCHVPDNALDSVHDRQIAPDTSCTLCHTATVSNFLSGHYGDTVRTAGNGMNAGSVITCFSCHDSSNHDGGPLGDAPYDTVWSKLPANRLYLSCDSCHGNRASLHVTGTAHNNRIIDPSCGNCHTSDISTPGNPGNGTLSDAADVDSLHRSDCTLCHNYSGTAVDAGIVRQAIQQGLNGNQITCTNCHADHGAFEHPVEVGPNDLSYDAPGQLCSDCHVVANWTEIAGIEHNVDTNGAGSCATCHNSSRQEVIDTIALHANPTHCLDCHADKELAPHGSVDHVALGYVVGEAATCLSCHDPGTTENATVSVIHSNKCFFCHTTGLDLQPGIPADGGDCASCHTSDWEVTHTVNACFDCHSGAITNNNYAANFGGESPAVFSNIAEAFAATGSTHDLNSIYTMTQSSLTPPNGDIPIGANPCSGCHNPHLAQRISDTGGSFDPSEAVISLPTSHEDLWGDDAAERMDQYASDNGGVYRAPFFVGADPWATLTIHEPDGSTSRDISSNEVQGSTTPDYNTFCLSCHQTAIGLLRAIDFSSTGDVHGGRKAELVGGSRGFRVAPYTTDGSNSSAFDFPNYILSCLDCHEPHGSNNIYMLRSTVNGLKITTNMIDSQTSKELCVACHAGYLPHGDNDCLRCHYHGSVAHSGTKRF